MASTKVQLINGGFQDAEGNVLANGYLKMKLSQDEMASGVGQVAGGIEVQIPLDSNGNILGTPSPFTLSAVAVAAGVATYTGTITGGGNNAYNGVSFVIAGFVQGGNNGTFVCTGSTTTTLTFAATTQVNETHAGTATGGTQNVWPNDQLTPTNSFYFVKGYKSNGQLSWGPNAQQVVGATPFDCNTWTPNFLPNFSPATTAISLQTNEVANGSQSLLDLHAGSGITLTDNGSGRVTIAGVSTISLQTNGTPNGSQSKLNLVNGSNVTITDDGSGDITIGATVPKAFSTVKRFGMVQWANGAATSLGLGTVTGVNFSAPTSAALLASTDPPGIQFTFPATTTQWAYGSSQTSMAGWPVSRSLYVAGAGRLNDSTTSASSSLRYFPVWLYDQGGSGGTVFFSSLGTDPTTNGKSIGIYGTTNGGTANFKAYCSTGGVKTEVDTGVLIDSNYHYFEIIGNSGGTSFQFKIDGNLVATITTNIPAGTTLMCLYVCGMQNTSATNPQMKINFYNQYVECS